MEPDCLGLNLRCSANHLDDLCSLTALSVSHLQNGDHKVFIELLYRLNNMWELYVICVQNNSWHRVSDTRVSYYYYY